MSAVSLYRRLLAVFLLPALVPAAFGLSVKQLSQEQILSRAECVFVGTVTAKRSRWRRPGAMTETIYTIRVDEPVYGSGRVFPALAANSVVELAFAGGAADGKAIWIPGIPTFELNRKAVFFCDKDGTRHFSALVGISQGLVPVGRSEAGESGGQRVTASMAGSSVDWVAVNRSVNSHESGHPEGQSLTGFLDDIRSALATIKGGLADAASSSRQNSAAPPPSAVSEGYGAPTVQPPPASGLRTPQWKIDNDKVLPSLFVPINWDLHGIGGLFSLYGREFVEATKSWNAYSSIFTFSSILNPLDFFNSSEWGMLNFKNDVVLTDTATLKEKWGVNASFEHGNNAFMAFGINNFNILNSLADVDLIFNSSVDWTDDQETALSQSDKKYFRSTVVHMLGLAMGRVHQTEENTPSNGRVSVMNHFSSTNRPLMHHPFLDDAASIRAAYPDQANQITDLGIYFFQSAENLLNGPARVETVHLNNPIGSKFLGESVFLDARLENIGTRPISPVISFWLSREPRKLVAKEFLGSRRFTEMTPGSFSILEQERFTIPENPKLVGKNHYIIASVDNEEDDEVENNDLASTIQPFLVKDSTDIRFRKVGEKRKLEGPELSFPPVNAYTIAPGEKRRESNFAFRQDGHAGSVLWTMTNDRSYVVLADKSGYLKKGTEFSIADFHIDATGLSPGTYWATNWLHPSPGFPIPMPIEITVPAPSLDQFPSGTASFEARVTRALLGEEFTISQTIKNNSAARVRYQIRLDPPGWESTTFVYGNDRVIRRYLPSGSHRPPIHGIPGSPAIVVGSFWGAKRFRRIAKLWEQASLV